MTKFLNIGGNRIINLDRVESVDGGTDKNGNVVSITFSFPTMRVRMDSDDPEGLAFIKRIWNYFILRAEKECIV